MFYLDKMIIRIKKQEQDVDIEGKYSSTDHEEIVYVTNYILVKILIWKNISSIYYLYQWYRSYTCEFVQNVDETKSDCSDILDESMETVRQDENFSKFALNKIIVYYFKILSKVKSVLVLQMWFLISILDNFNLKVIIHLILVHT